MLLGMTNNFHLDAGKYQSHTIVVECLQSFHRELGFVLAGIYLQIHLILLRTFLSLLHNDSSVFSTACLGCSKGPFTLSESDVSCVNFGNVLIVISWMFTAWLYRVLLYTLMTQYSAKTQGAPYEDLWSSFVCIIPVFSETGHVSPSYLSLSKIQSLPPQLSEACRLLLCSLSLLLQEATVVVELISFISQSQGSQPYSAYGIIPNKRQFIYFGPVY